MSTPTTEGRRETRKRETRRALHDAALKLFIERGVNSTTIADIARAAGVSPRTFFGYYTSKEAALFGPLEDLGVLFESRLGATNPAPDALDTFREWVISDVLVSGELEPFGTEAFREIATASDGVAAYGLRFRDRVANALAEGLRAQFQYSPEDPTPDAAAAAVVAGLTSGMPLGTHATAVGSAARDGLELIRLVDRAMLFARAGIAAVSP